MSRGDRRAFRPLGEEVEGRALTTGGLLGGWHAPAPAHHGFVKAAGLPRLRQSSEARLAIGPGIGQGLLRLNLPFTFVDYGVVTLWNNTNTVVPFAISASTFRGGQPFPFLLGPGQFHSFFAPVAPVTGVPPVFLVGFDPWSAPTVLPQVNLVYEAPNYIPSATAGFPYAINFGPYGYTISRI